MRDSAKKKIAILFSGGTDSTVAAALMAEKFDVVHLVTYDRFGLYSASNAITNIRKLKERSGSEKFVHSIIPINKIMKHVFYERYLRNVLKFRFFLVSNCGLCKLAMHVRTVIFCLENEIANVCDGANKGMRIFPDQMDCVLGEIKGMYSSFGIDYSNPVFNFAPPQDIDYPKKFNLQDILLPLGKGGDDILDRKMTTGHKAYELGLLPSDNVKGTKIDRDMQGFCQQLVLSNIFILWYYLYDHDIKEYQDRSRIFYREKIKYFSGLLKEYQTNKLESKLFKLIER